MGISSKEIGIEIKRLRKMRSISQSELAEGICSQTTISSIEIGRAFPSVDILYHLSNRLNVTMDYFFQHTTSQNQIYTSETIKNIERLLKAQNYIEILEITTFERKLRESRNLGGNFNQFIDWHHYRASQLNGDITWKECVEKLSTLVKSRELNTTQFQALKIKNVIANVLSENKEDDAAQKIYEDILKENIPLEAYQRFKLKVYFNLAKLHFYKEEYTNSVEIAQNGIDLSINLEDMSMLGNLYLQAARSMINLDFNKEKIIDYIEKARFYCKVLNKCWHIEFIDHLEKDYYQKMDYIN
ncbi:helix-turn-helix transcriptional regulator (plasmid) [Sutcliffiella horikoshii]|uniref:helix-turn-helix domain-containing protein n=1 Tax=Sutcliffiella horikoshii TaxID=79883 RepID=UPI001CBA97DE|nr:helix-turn-helix domain-containing protein [Sutcliffiella horikoshii]UAL49866.1 helix-turn-helix transcriptional regulator [Sutcliffiella horikoshii]